jgi:hypothetical protein
MQLMDKLPKSDPRWSVIGRTFVNETLTVYEAASRVWNGHAFTVQLTKPWRDKANYLQGQHLGLDFDSGENAAITALVKDPFVAKYGSFVYSTYSARPTEGIHKSRVIFVLDTPIRQPSNYVLAATAMLWLFGAADPQCKDSVRQWFGTFRKDIEFLGGILPLELVKDIIQKYQETGQRLRKAYRPKPFNGENDDESLDRLVSAMAGAASGNRNATLNRVAFLLGRDIAGGRIEEGWGKQCILNAARTTGLEESEIEYHLDRSVEAGKEAAMLNLH